MKPSKLLSLDQCWDQLIARTGAELPTGMQESFELVGAEVGSVLLTFKKLKIRRRTNIGIPPGRQPRHESDKHRQISEAKDLLSDLLQYSDAIESAVARSTLANGKTIDKALYAKALLMGFAPRLYKARVRAIVMAHADQEIAGLNHSVDQALNLVEDLRAFHSARDPASFDGSLADYADDMVLFMRQRRQKREKRRRKRR